MPRKLLIKIEVNIKTRSKTSIFNKVGPNLYYAQVKSAPIDNRANLELLQLISAYFKVNQAQIKFIKGLSSKNKIIAIYE